MSTDSRKHLPAECESNVRDVVLATISDTFDVDLNTDDARRSFRRRFHLLDKASGFIIAAFWKAVASLLSIGALGLISFMGFRYTAELLHIVSAP